MKLAEGAVSFILLVVYLAWIFVSGTPHQRLQRTCDPIHWMGQASLSVDALMVPGWEEGTARFFQRTDYDCQYVLWRQFYESTWKREQKQRKPQQAGPDVGLPAHEPASGGGR